MHYVKWEIIFFFFIVNLLISLMVKKISRVGVSALTSSSLNQNNPKWENTGESCS